MNIKQLAKRISSELEPDEEGEAYLVIHREWNPNDQRGLRRMTIETILTYKERVDRAVPNEFDYGICYDEGKLILMIQFNDGEHASSGCFHPLNPRHDAVQLAAELRGLDWQKLRLESITRSNLNDDIADHAEDYLPEWIPSAEIQEVCKAAISDYLGFLQKVNQSSGVLAGNLDTGTLMNCTVENSEQRSYWISQQLGQGNVIMAVVENGILLSPEKTDELRRYEIDRLPRIAKAKAEGRYQKAFEELIKESPLS